MVAVVGGLFAWSLADNWESVVERGVAFHPAMILAVVLFAVAVPVSGLLWGGIVNTLVGRRAATARQSIAVHCASWLLKYIPGQIGSLVNKVDWGARRGVPRTTVAISFVYENVFLVLAATVPSVVVLAVALGADALVDNFATIAVPILAVIPLVVLSSRPVFRRLVGPVFRRVARADLPESSFLGPVASIGYQLAYLVPRVLNGAGFVVLCATVAEVEPGDWAPLAAAYMLAGAAGLLAIFVPSGLGVREAVIVVFAAPFIGLTEAIIASIIARLLSTLGDALVALVYVVARTPVTPLESE